MLSRLSPPISLTHSSAVSSCAFLDHLSTSLKPYPHHWLLFPLNWSKLSSAKPTSSAYGFSSSHSVGLKYSPNFKLVLQPQALILRSLNPTGIQDF